jgi:ATP-dependent Clp protease adaptor protein ClpS
MSKAVALPELDEVEETEQRPKLHPMHIIVVFNDDDHTFEYVVELFMKVFSYPLDKSVKLAVCIHNEGRTIVWNGTKELGELKIEQLRNGGPDFWTGKRVDYPIICELQPVD